MKQAYLILSLAVSVILCSAIQSNATDLSDRLVAYYPFNGNAIDESGNGHDGTALGALAYDTNGIAGKAAVFDGSSAKIQIPHADDLNLDGPFSISFWIKSDGTSPASGLLAKIQSSSPRDGYMLAANAVLIPAEIKMNINQDWPAIHGKVYSTNSVFDGSWHHIMATYDEENLKLYLDGQVEMEAVYTNGLSPNSMPLYIGWDPYASDRYFNGQMDEVRIYNRVLSEQEVQELYVEADDGLVAHYPFTGNANDESGNGYDGTVNGATLTEDRFGNADSAYYFNGSDAQIILPQDGPLNFERTEPFSESFWINSSTYSGSAGKNMISKMVTGAPGTGALTTMVYGHLLFRLASDVSTGNYLTVECTTPVNDGGWHHVVVTYDGSSDASGVTAYIDGELEPVTYNANSLTGSILNDIPQTIGARNGSFHYDGLLDDMRFYNRVLSEQEVQELYGEADDGLVAHFPFNGNALDESGNGHDGVVNGATLTADRFGNANSAYLFDGADDFIEVADHMDLRLANGSYSICTWFYETQRSPGHAAVLMAKRDSGSAIGWFQPVTGTIASYGAGRLQHALGSVGQPMILSSSILPVGTWNYTVVSYDSPSQTVRIYINGVLDNVHTNFPSPNDAITRNMFIGRDSHSSQYHFNGMIDDVRIYNRALSEEEIQELYSETGDDSLIAHYPFDGNADDESGNGHDGAVSGATLTADRFGNADSAYLFDGVDDSIQIADSEALRLANTDFTISTWFYGTARNASYHDVLITKRGLSNTNGWFSSVTANTVGLPGPGKVFYQVSAGNNPQAYSAEQVSLNSWNHAVTTYEKATETIQIHINGVLDSTTLNIPSPNALTTANMVIGLDSALGGYGFNGAIDDIHIYNRVLSEQEIQELYADDGLIAHYPFSGNALDESGNGHDGTVNGATLTADRFGNANSAYLFDGADDFIEVADHMDLRLANGSYSICTWFNETQRSPGHAAVLMAKRDSGSAIGWFQPVTGTIASYGAGRLQHALGSVGQPMILSSSILPVGTWNYTVVSYDSPSQTVRIYINGVLDNVHTNFPSPNDAITRNMFIGRDSHSSQYHFNGMIDDVRIYDRALSEEKIQELYSDGLPSAPMLEIYTDVLTNTLVVADEAVSRTMTLTNAGNADLEFSFCPPPPSEDDGDGLVAYYPFNGQANDESGNGHDGLEMGALSYDIGIVGECASFDGSSAKIKVSHADDLNLDGPFSISIWIKSDGTSPASGLLAKIQSNSPRDGYLLAANAVLVPAEIKMNINKDWPAILGRVYSTNSVFDGSWHHIMATYNEENLKLYLDGQIEMQVSYTNGLSPNSMPLYIGWDPYASDRYFNGQMDEVRIYNRALSESEISELAGQGSDPGLVAYYPFSGNAVDESGNGHDGGVIGATLTTDRFGNPDSAYYFDGINDRIDLPAETLDFERTDSFSQSFWIKTSDDGIGNIIISKMLSSISYRGIAVSLSDGVLKTSIISSGTAVNRMRVDGTTLLSDNKWHHVVVSYDGSSLASGINYYIDGSQETAVIVADTLTGTILNSATPTIGSRMTGNYFTGGIDDVCIYDRVLSEQEVKDLFNESNPAEVIDLELGLVANYPFDGDASDATGNGADGIVEGATLMQDRFGNANKAFRFDEDAYIRSMAGTGPADITGRISMAAWINPEQFVTKDGARGFRRTIVRKMSRYNSYGYVFGIDQSGLLNVFFDNSSNGGPAVTALNMVPLLTNQWSHVAATYDGTQVRFYVDGMVVDAQPCDLPLRSTTEKLCIGRIPDFGSAYFYGGIDEVRLYDRVLSDEEVVELYSEVPEQECALPDWLSIEPLSGTVDPEESMDISLTYNASNLVAGDYVEHLLQLFSNDPEYPVVDIPVSMWVVPSAPDMYAEPQCTVGKSNEVAWTMQDGPVEYWVEAEAVQHCTPSSCLDSNVPDGWLNLNSYAENPEDWFMGSGWIDSTSYWFTGLRLNNVYRYRVKASVVTAIGRLESDWSDWTASGQVPVILDRNADHVPGWWKRWYFGTEDNFISSMDSDGDHLCDFDEYVAGTNPHDARSRFKIGKGKAQQNGDFVVNWDAIDGRVCSVYWSLDAGGPYELLETNIPYPQNSYTDTVHRAESGGFYKVDIMLDH